MYLQTSLSPLFMDEGREERRLSITSEAFTHLSCSHVTEEGERPKEGEKERQKG